MIAVTRARGTGHAKSYVDKIQARGTSRTEALRLLRREPSDAAFT